MLRFDAATLGGRGGHRLHHDPGGPRRPGGDEGDVPAGISGRGAVEAAPRGAVGIDGHLHLVDNINCAQIIPESLRHRTLLCRSAYQ